MPSEVSDSSFAALMTSHQHPPLNTSTLVPSGSWDMSWTEPSSFPRWLQNPNGRLSSKPRLSTGYVYSFYETGNGRGFTKTLWNRRPVLFLLSPSAQKDGALEFFLFLQRVTGLAAQKALHAGPIGGDSQTEALGLFSERNLTCGNYAVATSSVSTKMYKVNLDPCLQRPSHIQSHTHTHTPW